MDGGTPRQHRAAITPASGPGLADDIGRMASQLGTHYHGSSGDRSSLSGRDGDRTQCTRGPRLSRRSLDDPETTRRSQQDAKVQDRLRTQRGCCARNAARRCEAQESQTVKGKALCEINCVSPCPATIEIQTSFPRASARTCVGFRVRSVTRVDETRRFATQSTASPVLTARRLRLEMRQRETRECDGVISGGKSAPTT
jgi:hypothetical protein